MYLVRGGVLSPRGVLSPGGCLLWAEGGVCSGGCTWSRGVCSRGYLVPGGLLLGGCLIGGCIGSRGTPAQVLPPPVNRILDTRL